MPRYHFTLGDGAVYLDPDGIELPDLGAARIEAVRYASEWLHDHPDEIWRDGSLQVTVSDERSLSLFMVTVITTNAPTTKT